MSEIGQKLQQGCDLLGFTLDEERFSDLELYFVELKKWNRKINLVAKSISDKELLENHFLDSMALLPFISDEGTHLLDFGTGAGFPGLVCKVARPQLEVTLVEPRQKRVSFLKHITRSLQLEGVHLHCCRIEDEEEVPVTGGYSHITCRAVTDLAQLLPMVERFAPAEVELVIMKGPRWREEMAVAEDIMRESSFNLHDCREWTLPFSKAERALLIFGTHEK